MKANFSFPRLLIVFLGAVSLALLCVAAALYKPVGGDFTSRYNEVTSVLDGTDPYLIWTGQVKDDRYYPYNRPELRKSERQSRIHAYTPWSYTYLMPLVACLPIDLAWTAYRILMAMAILMIACFSFSRCRAAGGSVADGVVGIAAAFAIGATYGVTFIYGNYGIFIAVWFALMTMCLNAGRNVLAGVCWAFALTKPQCAALLFVPLLIQRRWTTIVTAALVCLAASVIPALLCSRSPIEMILQVRNLGAGYYSGGTAILPDILVSSIWGSGFIEAREFLFPINAILGISLCACASWLVRKADDWIVRLSPAMVLSMAWTYMICFDRCVFAVPAVALTVWCIKERTRKAERMWAFGIVLVFFCGILPLCTCDGFLQKIFSLCGWEYSAPVAHWCLSAFDAVVGLLIVVSVIVGARMLSARIPTRNAYSAELRRA